MCLHKYTDRRATQSECPSALGAELGWWCRRSHPPSLTPQSPKTSTLLVPPRRQKSRCKKKGSQERARKTKTKKIRKARMPNICFVGNSISRIMEGAGGLIRNISHWTWAKMKRWGTTLAVQMLKKRKKKVSVCCASYLDAKHWGYIINDYTGAAASL